MDKIESLEKLQQLKENGTITEAEFEQEKNNILSNSNNNTTNNNSDKKANKALTGFILGLCSIIAWILPLVGYPVTITGIALSAIGLKSKNRGLAIAGLILSIMFLIVTLINSAIGVMMMTSYY